MKISLALNSNVSRRGRGPQKSKSTLLRAGLPKNRYDSFCFSNNSFLPSFLLAAAAAAQKRKGGVVAAGREGMCLFFFPSIKCSVLQKMRFTFR
jgi:hypothetical protein